MLQIVFKNHALSTTTLNLLKILASPKSMFKNHHYLAPHSIRLKGIFVSQCSGLNVPRIWSLSRSIGINVRRFCSEGTGELEKGLVVVSDVVDAVTNENNTVVDTVVKIVEDHAEPQKKMEDALEKSGIELTTPLVMEVLERVRHEETVALRFFMWAGNQENYTHETCAYNVIIDALSSTTYKVKQFRILCDLLDYMKRRNKWFVPVDALLVILKRYAEKHLTHLQKVHKWKRRSRIQPETHAINLLIDGLCKCSLAELAEAMFRRVQSTVKPTSETYNILFFGWCRVRNPRRAMILLEEMTSLGFIPDSYAYNSMIFTFCSVGLITEATELLTFMKTQGSTLSAPTARSYYIMMMALVENDRMEQCFELLREMITTGCLPDVGTYKELIEGMCVNGKIEAAYRVLEEMSRNGYPPDVVTYNCFLKVLCDNKKSDEALRLYKKMIEVGCMPSVQTYNMIIEMYYTIGDVDGALDAWHEMERRGCKRNIDTVIVMIEGSFNNDNAKDACSLLEEVISRGVPLPYLKYESILNQLSATGNLQLIHRLSAHMRQFYDPKLSRRYALGERRHSRSLRGN